MKNKINVAELLKDCPNGMELDCVLFDNVRFEECAGDCIYIRLSNGELFALTEYGICFEFPYSKCIIFPKGKTTWEGFVPPCKFNDCDIVISNHGDIHIKRDNLSSYCCLRRNRFDETITTLVKFDRPATEEEKQKLFDAIKAHGYRWNADTKTLEKLIESKFKDGDIITTIVRKNYVFYSIYKNIKDKEIMTYVDYCLNGDRIYNFNGVLCFDNEIIEQRLSTEEEKQKLFDAIKENGYKWNAETKTLEKLIEPKFKVGDRIKKKNGKDVHGAEQGVILSITDDTYDVAVTNNMGIFVPIADQDDWELIELKFKVGDRIRKGNPIELEPKDVEIISDDKATYWNQVRVQASIGAMQVILGKNNYDTYKDTALQAVGYADALVKELKKQ